MLVYYTNCGQGNDWLNMFYSENGGRPNKIVNARGTYTNRLFRNKMLSVPLWGSISPVQELYLMSYDSLKPAHCYVFSQHESSFILTSLVLSIITFAVQ